MHTYLDNVIDALRSGTYFEHFIRDATVYFVPERNESISK